MSGQLDCLARAEDSEDLREPVGFVRLSRNSTHPRKTIVRHDALWKPRQERTDEPSPRVRALGHVAGIAAKWFVSPLSGENDFSRFPDGPAQ